MKAEIDNKGEIMLDEDIIWVTTGLYEAFLQKGRPGMEAYLLYSHLVYTARRQGTNSVWAIEAYLKKGLKIGKTRLVAARALLVEMGLIEITRKRKSDGTLEKSYTKVKTSRLWAFNPLSPNSTVDLNEINPLSPNPRVDASTSGCQATNALKENVSALDF